MATRKRIFATEQEMYACWSRSAGQRMVTTDGRNVLVVYPGIRTDSRGPDYKNAVVSFDSGAQQCGDVELHIDGRDWHRHGHDIDPSYDKVVLHVVGSASGATGLSAAVETRIPVAVLRGPIMLPGLTVLPCAFVPDDDRSVRDTMARAGLVRLLGRARRLAHRGAEAGRWQPLAAKISRALGYSANADMAESIGWLLIEPSMHHRLVRCDHEDRRAIVLGMAGLLPSQRRGAALPVTGDAPAYEAYWSTVEGACFCADPKGWRLRGLYPNNSPVRRIVALADLWPHMEGLPDLAVDAILSLADQPKSCAVELERMIRLPGCRYWRGHSDFGIPTRESDVIGADKAREAVVNAVLPWVAAYAMWHRDSSLLQSVVTLFSSYPAARPNTVTRHMQRQCRLSSSPPTAAVQQGLLHLFTVFCRNGRCGDCPLGNR